jgi:hypothetical protein
LQLESAKIGLAQATFQIGRFDWRPELFACRREKEDTERSVRERQRALLTRVSKLLPLIQADEKGFRQFCREQDIARHGKLEIMLARAVYGPLDDATANRYGTAIRNGNIIELGVVRSANTPALDSSGRYIDDQITDPKLGRRVVEYFKPQGRIIDPCRATGSFHRAMPRGADWAEIREGRDFCELPGPWDWCITNPPWHRIEYNRVAEHAFRTCENVVFLGTTTLFSSKARLDIIRESGHALREIVVLPDWKIAGFRPQGFWLGAIHWQRGYQGGTIWTFWDDVEGKDA